jgi:hypothetical protein
MKATINSIEINGTIVRTILEIQTPVPRATFPASPTAATSRQSPPFEFHKVVEEGDAVVTVETYDWNGPIPEVGEQIILQSWWDPVQLEAVLDLDAIWSYESYPDNGDHDHCLLTWTTIAAYGDFERMGYRSKHGWITVAAYQEYIKEDRLRLRRKPSESR